MKNGLPLGLFTRYKTLVNAFPFSNKRSKISAYFCSGSSGEVKIIF